MVLQLFKRRNVATVEEDFTLEEDGMSDSGYLESQANNMEQITVRAEQKRIYLYLKKFTKRNNLITRFILKNWRKNLWPHAFSDIFLQLNFI